MYSEIIPQTEYKDKKVIFFLGWVVRVGVIKVNKNFTRGSVQDNVLHIVYCPPWWQSDNNGLWNLWNHSLVVILYILLFVLEVPGRIYLSSQAQAWSVFWLEFTVACWVVSYFTRTLLTSVLISDLKPLIALDIFSLLFDKSKSLPVSLLSFNIEGIQIRFSQHVTSADGFQNWQIFLFISLNSVCFVLMFCSYFSTHPLHWPFLTHTWSLSMHLS